MSKTIEELNQIKQECKSLSIKLQELSDDELKFVTGGGSIATVDSERLERTLTTTVDQSLQGMTAGVRVILSVARDVEN